jgi:hypothetical protein
LVSQDSHSQTKDEFRLFEELQVENEKMTAVIGQLRAEAEVHGLECHVLHFLTLIEFS